MSQDPRTELALLMVEKVRMVLASIAFEGEGAAKVTKIESESRSYGLQSDNVCLELSDGSTLMLYRSKVTK